MAIVRQLAQNLGLNSKIYQSKELRHITQYQLEEVVENAGGFAEVYPEQRYLLIKILQKLTHHVGFTGKNANDTPALQAATVVLLWTLPRMPQSQRLLWL